MRERFRGWDRQRKILVLILLVTFLRGIIYASITPLWQAPDEPFHYEYIGELGRKFGAGEEYTSTEMEILISMQRWDFWRYQNQLTPESTPWGFSDVPFFSTIRYLGRAPLYYYLCLPLYFPVSNLATDLRVYTLRLANVFLGVLIVFASYLIAREIFPHDEVVSLGTPIFVAFLPMHTTLMASINGDNLVNLLFCLFLYLAIKVLRKGVSWTSVGALVLIMILSFATKRTAIAQLPFALLIPGLLLFRRKSPSFKAWLRRVGLTSLWFLVLAALFVPASNLMEKVLKTQVNASELCLRFLNFLHSPKPLGRLVFNCGVMFRSFWGHFGWMSIPLDSAYYRIMLVVTLASVVGLLVWLSRLVAKRESIARWQGLSLLFLFFSLSLVALTAIFRCTIYEYVPLQGRYIFPTIAVAGLFFVLGLRSLIRLGGDSFKGRIFLFVLTAGFALFDLACLFGCLVPKFYCV